MQLKTYDINSPSKKIKLPGSLDEISGLGLYDDRTLICVNDEDGKIFILDLEKEEVIEKVKFGKSGDFEGVEVIGKEVFCIKSNGDLYRFTLSSSFEIENEKEYELPFSSSNDIEGLGYYAPSGLLVIVPKSESSIDKKDIEGKAIYGFDLTKEELIPEPLMLIKEKELKEITGEKKLKASGIAYHTREAAYYIIASAGNLMLKVSTSGKILEVQSIEKKVLRQPEGIVFDSNDNLYVASEGKGGDGYILKYNKKN